MFVLFLFVGVYISIKTSFCWITQNWLWMKSRKFKWVTTSEQQGVSIPFSTSEYKVSMKAEVSRIYLLIVLLPSLSVFFTHARRMSHVFALELATDKNQLRRKQQQRTRTPRWRCGGGRLCPDLRNRLHECASGPCVRANAMRAKRIVLKELDITLAWWF